MSPSQLRLNLLAERANDCTIVRPMIGTEITPQQALPVVYQTWMPAAEAASSQAVSKTRPLPMPAQS